MAGYMGKRQAADEITTVIKETDDESPNTRTTTIKRAPGGETVRAKSGASSLLGLLNSYLSGGNASADEDDIWASQNGAPSGAGMNSFIPWEPSPNSRSDIGVGRSQFPRVGVLDDFTPSQNPPVIPWESSPNGRSDIGVGRSQFPRVGNLDSPQQEPTGNPGPSLNPFAGMVPFVNPRGGATPPSEVNRGPQTFTGVEEPMSDPSSQNPPFIPWEPSPNGRSDIGIDPSNLSARERRGRPPSLTEVLFPATDTTDVTQPETPAPVDEPDRSLSVFERLKDFNGGVQTENPNRRDTGNAATYGVSTYAEDSGNSYADMAAENPTQGVMQPGSAGASWLPSQGTPGDVGPVPRGQASYPDEKPIDTVGGAEKAVVESAENDQASYTVQGQQPSMAQSDALTRTWGKLAYDPKKRRDEYMKRLNKIYANTMALEALAIVSGKRSRAGMYSKMAMGKLDAMQKFDSEDRLQQLSNSLYFDRDGNYAPPANKAEAHSALMQMGASLNEATAIVGHVPEAVSQDLKEWYKYNPTTNQVETRQYPGKKGSPGSGWNQKYEVANNKYKDANPDSKNDFLGGTDAEKGMLEVELSNKLSTLVPGSVEHNNVSTQLNSLRQQIYGDPADAFKDLFPQETRDGDMPKSYKGVIPDGSYSDALKHFMDPNNYDKLSYNFYRGWTPQQKPANVNVINSDVEAYRDALREKGVSEDQINAAVEEHYGI